MDDNFLQGKKYLWRLPQADTHAALTLAARYNLCVPIAQAMLSRGFSTPDVIDAFLFSSLERDVPQAHLMKDLERAVDRIAVAIKNKEKILVFGDYDVDGITATSLVMHCLLPLGAQINFYLPNRHKDGYGLSAAVVERAAANGYRLIITVDNGISAYDAACRAKELGVDLIITDHHQAHENVPPAYAIVDPNQSDCSYPFKSLAGVGVAFKVMGHLYERQKISLPDKVYELLTMGTIADVVPLVDENRFWVRYGLHRTNSSESVAVSVLKQNANLQKPKLTARDIGFGLAPQLNALGRLEDPRQAVGFLLGLDRVQVQHVGDILFNLNQARKDIERVILAEVEQTIALGHIDPSRERCILAASKTWPPGVIGLVASRLVSAYGRPTILLQISPQGDVAKGSCRSIPACNIFHALQHCSAHLTQFGGHAQAAGLSLPVSNIALFKQALEEYLAQTLTPFDLQQKLFLDAQLGLPDATKKLTTDLELLEPFGNSNEEPLFLCKELTVVKPPQLLKDAHVKCLVFDQGVLKPVIFFNRPDLFELLSQYAQEQKTCDMVVQVREN
ncbi:single-stranded-DNA-specific exonuclease RecJ, partial [Candidatus Dependentiae bacterium HGW-Dependentiae-1]